jgi:hypothetical protein
MYKNNQRYKETTLQKIEAKYATDGDTDVMKDNIFKNLYNNAFTYDDLVKINAIDTRFNDIMYILKTCTFKEYNKYVIEKNLLKFH